MDLVISAFFHYIRIQYIGVDYSDANYLNISGIEFYGTILDNE